MADKFKNKFRISSARLKSWDYGNDGSYFITICTKNREHFFGEIVETRLIASPQEMQLNECGKLAEQFWIEIPNHFPFIELGNFVVMPNHVHGILIIDKTKMDGINHNAHSVERDAVDVETRLIASLPASPSMSTQSGTSANPPPGGITGNKNPMLHENISRIIRWYKGIFSFEIHKINPDFGWQSRFHDHIIRDAESFERIQNYIANNPRNWKDDKFYS